MSSVATAVVAGAVIGGVVASDSSRKAAHAAEDAAEEQVAASKEATDDTLQAQREQLDYLKDVDKLPREYREAALAELSQRSGESLNSQQTQMIRDAKASPLYTSIMGGQKAGEEAILRNAAATGGLRSGNVQGALTDYGSQLSTSALLESYNQQLGAQAQQNQLLQGLAGTPLQTANIANTMGSMGATSAAGLIAQGTIGANSTLAQAQAAQAGTEGIMNSITTGITGLANYYGGTI